MKEESIQKTFSNNLKRLLEEQNKTQLDLAKYLNVSNTTVNNYVKGYNTPRMDRIDKISNFFGVTRSDLISNRNKDIDLSSIPGVILPQKYKKIPILGTIICGDPIISYENILGYISVFPEIEGGDFTLQADGDSMIDAGINEGDYVFFRQTPEVENGSIAAVRIDNKITLKKFYKNDNSIILQPCNQAYTPIVINEDECEDISILGEMIGVYSKRNK